MAKLNIDGQEYQVSAGDNLLKAALSLGLDLPYFCWHPALGSVGSCRQCAVMQYQDADDTKGRLVMACMTPVSDGMYIGLEAPEASEFRSDILELLMTNHPHDCPVCEEGGECHLQDMTVMTGHTSRHYDGLKRSHKNQYLGPFISHEMNRCIACYRCVRFYNDYAGGDDLQVLGVHNNVYFGRHEPGVLENEFSGNLVEVCPTGVFTDKTLSENYTRKWDLQVAPSICTHCALGCNTSPGERYGELRRIVNRYNGDVNGYFLCDRGRFGYGFVNGDQRIKTALIKQQPENNKPKVDKYWRNLITDRKIIGIGSTRATLEANFALQQLVGKENFYTGLGLQEQALLTQAVGLLAKPPAAIATLKQVESADAVIILGEDITNTAPRLALAVRQALRNESFVLADQLRISRWLDAAVREAAQNLRSPLVIASSSATRLDDVASELVNGSAKAIARFGFALAHSLDNKAPAVSDLSDDEKTQIQRVAEVLKKAKRPLVICGTGSQSNDVLAAATNLIKAINAPDKMMSLVVPDANSIGLGLLGDASFIEARKRLDSNDVQTVVVLETDLYRCGELAVIDDWLQAVEHLVVIDHSQSKTTEHAELVLPAATFAETEGTLISAEGRAQRFFSVMPVSEMVQDSWAWLAAAGAGDWQQFDQISSDCCRSLPALQPVLDVAPDAGFRIQGMKIPRQPHRYSGRTAMTADINVSEQQQPQDQDSALAFTMEGAASCALPPALNPGVWAPSWNSNQAVNKFQDEIGGDLQGGDPGVRLFEKVYQGRWLKPAKSKSKYDDAKLITQPLHHIFGSEELSIKASAIAERAPDPYLALHPDQAQVLGLVESDIVQLFSQSGQYRLPLKIAASLAPGMVGLPVGLPGMPVIDGGIMVELQRLDQED